jgi:hypothetical protein
MNSATYSDAAAQDLEKTLPRSEIVFPSSFPNRLKYGFWRVYTPLHPLVRDMTLALGIVSHSGRQNFLIGKIAPGQSPKSLIDFLVEQGYGNHFIAWKDDGELVNLRRVIDFTYQYHIRIFADGEVRGHYEYTPECYPILHFKAVNQKDCRDEFLVLLKGKIVPA